MRHARCTSGAANVPVQINHTSFRSNTAILSGGAVYLGQPGLIARSEFRGNASSAAGGGLHAQDTVNVMGVTFAHNTAAADGGAARLAAQPGSINRLENSILADNQAAGHGAGQAISSGKSIEIVHTTFATDMDHCAGDVCITHVTCSADRIEQADRVHVRGRGVCAGGQATSTVSTNRPPGLRLS